jgi:hypothetical protein
VIKSRGSVLFQNSILQIISAEFKILIVYWRKMFQSDLKGEFHENLINIFGTILKLESLYTFA